MHARGKAKRIWVKWSTNNFKLKYEIMSWKVGEEDPKQPKTKTAKTPNSLFLKVYVNIIEIEKYQEFLPNGFLI